MSLKIPLWLLMVVWLIFQPVRHHWRPSKSVMWSGLLRQDCISFFVSSVQLEVHPKSGANLLTIVTCGHSSWVVRLPLCYVTSPTYSTAPPTSSIFRDDLDSSAGHFLSNAAKNNSTVHGLKSASYTLKSWRACFTMYFRDTGRSLNAFAFCNLIRRDHSTSHTFPVNTADLITCWQVRRVFERGVRLLWVILNISPERPQLTEHCIREQIQSDEGMFQLLSNNE